MSIKWDYQQLIHYFSISQQIVKLHQLYVIPQCNKLVDEPLPSISTCRLLNSGRLRTLAEMSVHRPMAQRCDFSSPSFRGVRSTQATSCSMVHVLSTTKTIFKLFLLNTSLNNQLSFKAFLLEHWKWTTQKQLWGFHLFCLDLLFWFLKVGGFTLHNWTSKQIDWGGYSRYLTWTEH